MKIRALLCRGGVCSILSLLSLGCSNLASSDSDGRDEAPPVPKTDPSPLPGDDGGEGARVVDIADTSCVTLAALCTEIYPANAISPLLGLQRAGESWLARGVWESGFVLFDDDGAHASSEFITTGALDRVAASGDVIHVATVDTEGVKARRYRMTGAPLSDVIRLSDEQPDEVAIGYSFASALAFWSTPTRVVARAIGERGPMGDGFELESNVRKDDIRIALASSVSAPLAVSWSDRRVADSHYRTFFVRASKDGVESVPRTLFSGLERQHVIALRETGSGYVLLLEIEQIPWIVPLSSFGDRMGPAHRLMGITRAHDLSVGHNGDMLLAALRDDGRDALMLLDSEGAPKSDWHCIHAYPSDTEHVVSVAENGDGFAVLYRSVIAQELLYRVDPETMKASH